MTSYILNDQGSIPGKSIDFSPRYHAQTVNSYVKERIKMNQIIHRLDPGLSSNDKSLTLIIFPSWTRLIRQSVHGICTVFLNESDNRNFVF